MIVLYDISMSAVLSASYQESRMIALSYQKNVAFCHLTSKIHDGGHHFINALVGEMFSFAVTIQARDT